MTRKITTFSKNKEKDITILLIDSIIEAIKDKKGNNIVLIDFNKIENRIFDYFIICEATNKVQAEAIFESVDRKIKQNYGIDPYHKEGLENAEWILIDYIDIVVHIFQENPRKFYRLEDLWADADIKNIN